MSGPGRPPALSICMRVGASTRAYNDARTQKKPIIGIERAKAAFRPTVLHAREAAQRGKPDKSKSAIRCMSTRKLPFRGVVIETRSLQDRSNANVFVDFEQKHGQEGWAKNYDPE